MDKLNYFITDKPALEQTVVDLCSPRIENTRVSYVHAKAISCFAAGVSLGLTHLFTARYLPRMVGSAMFLTLCTGFADLGTYWLMDTGPAWGRDATWRDKLELKYQSEFYAYMRPMLRGLSVGLTLSALGFCLSQKTYRSAWHLSVAEAITFLQILAPYSNRPNRRMDLPIG